MVLKKDKTYKNISTAIFLTISCVLFLSLFSQAAIAKTLTEYKNNVEFLQKKFVSITTDEVTEEFINDVFKKATQMLPEDDEVEIGEAKVSVNNKWLSIEITKYKSATNADEKTRILKGISERLEAIQIKINEVESANESRVGKDEEKQKLAEILKREEFQKPSEEEKSLFQRFLDWLDGLFKKNPPKKEQEIKQLPTSNFGGVIYFLQFVVYALVIALIGFLVYKFAPFFIKKFREREKREKKERIILGEKISADETSEHLFSEAEELAKAGNLRDAIRKGYIAFLFELSERKHIGLAKHKTNRDYLRSVQRKKELYKNMDDLTLNYERHWYGFEDVDESDWQEFRKDYNQALGEK